MSTKSWGFNTKDMDQSVRPQDDFFHYANGSWLKRTKIPPDEARWGTFNILRKRTEVQLKEIIEELSRARRVGRGEEKQQIRDLYISAVDMKRRNRLDLKPIESLISKVRAIQSPSDILTLIPEFHRLGIGILWGASVAQDEKDVDTYILHMYQGGIGLPDREYYLLDKPEQKRVKTAYMVHIKRVLTLAGIPEHKAREMTVQILTFETQLAKASMRKEELRDPEKTYHKYRVSGLTSIAPAIPWRSYLAHIGAKPPAVNVMQPKFLSAVNKMLTEVPLDEWRAYLTWHVLNDAAAHLSDRFIRANFEFYGKVLTGTVPIKAPWRRALGVVNAALGEALGKIYVAKHFPPKAKHKMDELISNLFVAYKDRLLHVDWMTPPTKKLALKKLAAMERKIGYPKKWKSYKGLQIDPQ